MNKAFFTRKRFKQISLASVGFFLMAILLAEGFRRGYITPKAKETVDVAFNILVGIGIFGLIFGVTAPLNVSSTYYRSNNKEWRNRIENSMLFRHFIIEETGNE